MEINNRLYKYGYKLCPLSILYFYNIFITKLRIGNFNEIMTIKKYFDLGIKEFIIINALVNEYQTKKFNFFIRVTTYFFNIITFNRKLYISYKLIINFI